MTRLVSIDEPLFHSWLTLLLLILVIVLVVAALRGPHDTV